MKTTINYVATFVAALFLAGSVQAGTTVHQSKARVDSLLNEPAAGFTLKDISGKTVSLSDYKGKVLVLDFWATWCVPCRESFPATQLVVDKYKNDPDVKFLFIDTREKVPNYPELVKKFLAQTHYTFDVVFDEKGATGSMDKVFKQYVMPGIPTKFIIDRQGVIRFKSIGFNPSLKNEDVIKELTDMVEATKKL